MPKDRLKTPRCVTTIRCYRNSKNKTSTGFAEIPLHKSIKLTYRVTECKPKNLIYNYTRKVILCKPLCIFLVIYLIRHFKKNYIDMQRNIYIFLRMQHES